MEQTLQNATKSNPLAMLCTSPWMMPATPWAQQGPRNDAQNLWCHWWESPSDSNIGDGPKLWECFLQLWVLVISFECANYSFWDYSNIIMMCNLFLCNKCKVCLFMEGPRRQFVMHVSMTTRIDIPKRLHFIFHGTLSCQYRKRFFHTPLRFFQAWLVSSLACQP